MAPCATRDVLKRVGFAEDTSVIADRLPGYKLTLGNLNLTAAEVSNRYFQPIILIGGFVRDHRLVREIHFEMPLEVESYEQGVAWIVYGIGRDYRPPSPLEWFEYGKEYQDSLPWVREQKAYALRPQCTVERDWLKVAKKKILELAAPADEEHVTHISFDGEILRFQIEQTTIIVPATGKAWNTSVGIKTKCLDFLLKRFNRENINVAIWNDQLSFGNRCCKLAIAGATDESP